jgi:hypothetical protein
MPLGPDHQLLRDDLAMASRARWEIPADVVSRWLGLHGDDVVRRWLVDVRRLAASCEAAWRLQIEGFLPGGSLSCVLACRRADGAPLVLKLLAPWAAEVIGPEALALAAWNGRGAAALLKRTPDDRALLLSRVSPGTAFSPSGSDELDCEWVAGTFRSLASVAVPHELPPLSEALSARFARARRMAGQRQRWITAQDLDDAEQRAVALARATRDRGLVHGDAQDKNLLVSEPGGTAPEWAFGSAAPCWRTYLGSMRRVCGSGASYSPWQRSRSRSRIAPGRIANSSPPHCVALDKRL